MKILTFLLFFCSSFITLNAQFYDNNWVLGYFGGAQSPPDDSFGLSILNFSEAELKISNNQEIDIDIFSSGSAYSNYAGELLMISNNIEIKDTNNQAILNDIFNDDDSDNQTSPQSFVYLPFDELATLHYLKMSYSDVSPRVGQNISSSLIETAAGIEIAERVDSILSDSLTTGEMTACKHANGRDWWVLSAVANKAKVYSLIMDPAGVVAVDSQAVDFIQESGLGQAVFSPDGTIYVRLNGVIIGEPLHIDIFNFDRCTGQLFNHSYFTLPFNGVPMGAAISPSSQYLYIANTEYLYQFDLWADDVLSTLDTVAIYDGYTEWGILNSYFHLAHLAPDGKIYLNSFAGVKKLHVIEFPDKAGMACDVKQHHVQLPNNNVRALANHPNYRLGPIDGSSCDTLGLDNLPRAYFRVDRNSEDTLAFHFQNLSFYAPTDYNWTFGDGSGNATDLHADHTFSGPGIYQVCLTATNALGSDTYCRTLELGPSSRSEAALQAINIKTFPNPTKDILVVDLGDYLPLNGRFTLRDGLGRPVFSEQLLYRQARFDLSILAAGIYYYDFQDGGQKLASGKVVLVE